MSEAAHRKIHLLLIEDDEDDYILIRGMLAEVDSTKYEIRWVETYEDGVKELDRGIYDVCLLDYRLGTWDGLEILRKAGECPEKPPIIILTGQGDYRIDIEAMKHGAADYLVKGQINEHMLERAIRYSMDRKKSRDQLLESEKQLKYLSSKLLEVQENERRKVAAELHDNLGQLLTACKFNIENVLTRMDPLDSCHADLQSVVPMLQDAVEHVRSIYTQLRPSVLDDLGVAATLSWFCREFEKANPGIRVDREFDDVDERDIPDGLKLIIFRIVQEAMENIAVHSHADSASLSLFRMDRALNLYIRDNGQGFDVNRAMSLTGTKTGAGLISIKRRAELSGGSLEIESALDHGTSVRVFWALHN